MRLKNLLTFLVLLTVSVGTWAGTINDANTNYNPVGYSGIIEAYDLQPGELAGYLNDPTSAEYAKLTVTESYGMKIDALKISNSTLNKADLKALAKVGVNITYLDLDDVTLDSDASISDITSSTAKWISLPDGITKLNASSLPNCSALEAACALPTSTSIVAYVKEAGSLYHATRLIPANSNQNKLKQVTDLKLVGNLEPNDFMNGEYKDGKAEEDNDDDAGVLNKTWPQDIAAFYANYAANSTIKSIDLSEAIFSDPAYLRACTKYQQGLETVILPTSQNVIPHDCFNLCTSLNNLEIPANYTTIGHDAFHQCSSMTRIKIGKNIKSVGHHAFALCNALNTVEFEKGISDLDFEAYSFAGITGLKHVVLPEGVRNLGEYMFEGCEKLASVRLPSTLRHIEGHCFAGCKDLTQIAIPEGVETIGREAFGLSGLRDIYVMASDWTKLPKIYPFTNDPSQQESNGSTFGRNSLVNNNADVYGDVADDNSTEAINNLWHQAGNIATFLHYRPELQDFIDYNPWYDSHSVVYTNGKDSGLEGEPEEKEYLSDTYTYIDADGEAWPKQNNGSWRGDFVRVLTSGIIDKSSGQYTGTANATRDAWRQFMLKFGDAEPGKTVYEKKLKDVWYTMCFPYDLTDEQLEEFLTAEYNICEFSGVEVTENTSEDGSVSKSLILHFNDIASELVIHDDTDDTKDVKYLAYAGHPYMIHPNIGTVNENVEGVEGYDPSVVCYIPGVKDLSVDKEGNKVAGYQPGQSREQATDNGSKTLNCFQDQIVMKDGEVFTYTDDQGTEHTNMTFRFIGTYDKVLIPYGAYFLGTKKGDIYPKYWREDSEDQNRNTGWWNQYTAVVIPDDATEKWLRTVNKNGDGNVKSMDISFNDWDATIIPDALNIETVKDGQSENKTRVEFYNIVYDFNGNIVKKGDASIENLPTGMYIVNGKKYFVK